MKKHTKKKSKSRELLIRYYRIFDQFWKLFAIFIFHEQKDDHDVTMRPVRYEDPQCRDLEGSSCSFSTRKSLFLNVSNVLLLPRPNYVSSCYNTFRWIAIFRFLENTILRSLRISRSKAKEKYVFLIYSVILAIFFSNLLQIKC